MSAAVNCFVSEAMRNRVPGVLAPPSGKSAPAERALEQDLALVDDEGRAVEEPQVMEGTEIALRPCRARLRLGGGREPDGERGGKRGGETVAPDMTFDADTSGILPQRLAAPACRAGTLASPERKG